VAAACVVVVAAVAIAGLAGGSRDHAARGTAPPSSTAPVRVSTTAPARTTTTTVAPTTTTRASRPSDTTRMVLVHSLGGTISPKSVVASGGGLVFAQNMMYQHSITVYSSAGDLVKTIPDSVDLTAFGVAGHPGMSRGAPVEAAFTPDGRDAYVSNYSMYGAGFGPEGTDTCTPSSGYNDSFVYRVDVKRLVVDQVIKVGPVPKYVATTPDGRYVLVTNWCGYSLSVIDRRTAREVRRVPLGPYPRGIAVAPDSHTAYVAVMGTTNIAAIDLRTFAVSWMYGIGSGPRHVVISPDGHYLYVTLNGAGSIAKIDLTTRTVVGRKSTGEPPIDGDLGRRARALRRELQLRHGEQAAGERPHAAPDHSHVAPPDRDHLRPRHRERLGRVLRGTHPGVRRQQLTGTAAPAASWTGTGFRRGERGDRSPPGYGVPVNCKVIGLPPWSVNGTLAPSMLSFTAAGLPIDSLIELPVIDCDWPDDTNPANSDVPAASVASTQHDPFVARTTSVKRACATAKVVPEVSVARTGATVVTGAGRVVAVGRVTRARVVVVALDVVRPPCPWLWVITTTTAIAVAVIMRASTSCWREPGATRRAARAGSVSYAGGTGIPGVAGIPGAPGAPVPSGVRASAARERVVASCTALSVRR
jgi:YVTN family beta-propeller protein